MRQTRFLLLILFVMWIVPVYAQSSFFTVSYVQGKVEIKSRKKWADLKVSDKLNHDDEIRLDRNAVLHLTDSAGRPMLLTLPGIYKISDFIDNSRQALVLTSTGDIVLGRVTRVKQNFFGSAAPIKVLLLQDSTFASVYAKQFTIRWMDKLSKGPYIVSVKNLFKETIATIESIEQEIQFDLNDEKLQKERVLYFVIASKTDPKYRSAEHVLKRISIHERFRLDDVLAKEIILDNSRALDQLVLAGFYEENGLFVDSVNAYLEAIRLGGDDPIYSEAFVIFLQRYGLDP